MEVFPNAVYINFCDVINLAKVKTVMAACAEALDKFKPETLYLSISSPGGEVAAGIALYNFLRALPVRVVTHNIGSIDSIAVVVFLAGERRYATPTATFLFHGVQLGVSGATQLTVYQMRELLSGLDEDHNKIVHVITGRAQLSEDEVRELFKQGESKNAAFAQDHAIIEALEDFAVPSGVPFFSLNIN
jgi:ATP-dependent Clp protease, protease subunit